MSGELAGAPLACSPHPGLDHSTAVDARLEAGVSLLSELRLHMMAAVHTSRLSLAVTAPLKVLNSYSSYIFTFHMLVNLVSVRLWCAGLRNGSELYI